MSMKWGVIDNVYGKIYDFDCVVTGLGDMFVTLMCYHFVKLFFCDLLTDVCKSEAHIFSEV